jgi:hypothetical protein
MPTLWTVSRKEGVKDRVCPCDGIYILNASFPKILLFMRCVMRIVHKEFVPPGQTVNGKFYCEDLRQLRENVRHKRPEMWNRDWLLQHDNAPAHTSLVVREFLTKNKVTTVLHPAYSPDLVPCDF